MTGEVKEEILTRMGELGVRVRDGRLQFRPRLLRKSEFLRSKAVFEAIDVGGDRISIPLAPGTLAFTYCQVPVVYHLSSFTFPGRRATLKVVLPRWKDDTPGELPEVPTVSGVWRTADWQEREVYDLLGVRFVGHPDPRRILLPGEFEGHPLRKDYPLRGRQPLVKEREMPEAFRGPGPAGRD